MDPQDMINDSLENDHFNQKEFELDDLINNGGAGAHSHSTNYQQQFKSRENKTQRYVSRYK